VLEERGLRDAARAEYLRLLQSPSTSAEVRKSARARLSVLVSR